MSVAAGRISFSLGLQGPCSTTDTACSSSLVALHAARKSLKDGDCSMAVVVGVSVLSDDFSLAFANAGMLSGDGKCHTFDNAANGYCRAEGCGEAGEVLRVPAIVGVEKGDGLAGGEFEKTIAGGGDAFVDAQVGVLNGAGRDGSGEGADERFSGVAGAVLDHDKFPILVGLRSDGG
jgi:hypothetical protein